MSSIICWPLWYRSAEMAGPSSVVRVAPVAGEPLPYLAAQAACAGFSVALLYAVGNAAFILTNGAAELPYVYLWVAGLIPPLSLTYNRLQRRWAVARLNRLTIGLFGTLSVIAWWLGVSTRLDLAAYLLFVAYALALAFLTIAVTSQANRLYTEDQLVVRFPQMLAVQTAALILCGLLIAPLERWLGGLNQTLLIGAAVMLLMSLAFELTCRRFPRLAELEPPGAERPLKLEHLLRQALPGWLLGYQLLSSGCTLIVMYLVAALAQDAIQDSAAMTRFFGHLIAGATLGALLFLVFGAARVLQRWGISAGLLINPLGLLLILIPMWLTSMYAAENIVWLLGFAAGARALDFILSIGTTETSVNAAIQRLPDASQLPLINAVNALAIPLSYGVVAVLLLKLQAWSVALPGILLVTLAACLFWSLVALGTVLSLRRAR